MAKSKYPDKRSSNTELAQFLEGSRHLPQRADAAACRHGRLIFALDATASRQPSWDRACQLQSQMFLAAEQLGGLQLQLCYYRGFMEFHSSPWLNSSRQLLQTMTAVQCLGGYTQIGRVLDHGLKQHQSQPIQGIIIITDALEEKVDTLCSKAGKLGMYGVPLFIFQEGNDPSARQCFQQMAALSKGAYAQFDENSAHYLAQLLSAVAIFASGGLDALQQLQSGAARQLLQQLNP